MILIDGYNVWFGSVRFEGFQTKSPVRFGLELGEVLGAV